MKKIFSCAMIVAMAFALVSCGGGEQKAPEKKDDVKSLVVSNAHFVEGGLAKYIEIAPEGNTLQYIAIEEPIGDGRSKLRQIYRLNLVLKLIKENPEFQGVDASQLSLNAWSHILQVETLDKNGLGNSILGRHYLSYNSPEVAKIKNLLQGKVGDTVTVTVDAEISFIPDQARAIYEGIHSISAMSSADEIEIEK